MKKFVVIGLLAFVLAGCQTFSDICTKEARAHSHYMTFVAQFRTPTQVANAIAWHNQLQVACATGRPLNILKALATKGSEARR